MGALDGLRVVDVGLLVQAPQAALLLGDWGADVIKVELPGFGDQSRWLPAGPDAPRSAYFAACNRGKRSVTIDLRHPEGRDVFLRLMETTDVVVSNFVPGTMERWGLGYEDVAARNPRIVYAAGSTFGHRGPDAHREGADLAGQASGGLLTTIGRTGDRIGPVGVTIADHLAAQNLVAGILAALLHRERTGEGQRVEGSLLGGQIWAQASEITGTVITGRPTGRADGGHPYIPGLYGIFTTADGPLAIVGVAGPLREVFFDLIGAPELTEQFPEPLFWQEHKERLFPLVDAALYRRPTDEWCRLFAEHGIRFARIHDHADVLADPNAWDNEYLVRAPDANGTETTIVPAPVRFSATPGAPRADVPELGQHTEEVLLELGYDWDALAALREANAI